MKNVQKIDLGLTGYDELFANDEERKGNKLPRIFDIPISEIDDFPDHPFKVKIDEDMDQLVQSIKERGIITPVTLRPKEDGRYEIVSGHRRKKACELAGLDTVKAEVREMSRDEAMVPVSKMSKGLYGTVNMLLKCVFYSAVESDVIRDNPSAGINPRGGNAKKEKEALTDTQTATLLKTIKELPPYTFVMLGLYAGLRREEILGLQWDCVHIDEETPYISVRRAWRSVKNRPEVSSLLKTPAARRDIPIPQLLVDCLKDTKESSSSDYVIADSNGQPLSYSQFSRIWHYITVRTAKERKIYRYINGERIHHTISPKLGERCRTDKSIYYTLDFDVTPHLLRHTYITNLIHEGVDPKTVQYLAGHENSKVTMDIYAKVKYNKPWELATVVNSAFKSIQDTGENSANLMG